MQDIRDRRAADSPAVILPELGSLHDPRKCEEGRTPLLPPPQLQQPPSQQAAQSQVSRSWTDQCTYLMFYFNFCIDTYHCYKFWNLLFTFNIFTFIFYFFIFVRIFFLEIIFVINYFCNKLFL